MSWRTRSIVKKQKDDYIALCMGRMRKQRFEEICENVVPCVYAAIGFALVQKGWGFKRINDLFNLSQEIWQEKCFEEGDMCEQFLNETGIDVRSRVEEGEEG